MPNYVAGPISGFTEKIPVSTDYLPIVDTTDPFVKNKKATVGNIFKAVPYSSGTTNPAIAFGSSNNSGIFSPNGTQIGIRVGNTSNINVTQTTGAITLGVSDTGVSSRDLTLQAYGSGKINFSSPVTFTSNNFIISSSTNSDNNFKFDVSNILGSITLGVPGSGGTIVTETATQTLSNKTFNSTSFVGSFSVNSTTSDFIITGNKVGIGIAAPDYKLHVANDIKISGNSPSLRMTGATSEFKFTTNTGTSLDLTKDSTNLLSFTGTSITTNLDFYVGTGNSQGIILRSPNGNKFRITVNDSGTLSTTLVS